MLEREKEERWRSRARLLALLAGAMDTTTGVLLVAAPGFTLRLMGIAMEEGTSPFVRFVGAFVLGVGLSYFPPFLLEGRERCDVALRAVFVTTGLVRLSIGLFTGAAVLGGILVLPWLSVTVSDLALATLQALIVRSKVLDGEN
jgi:hypothetical protein